MKNNNSKRLRRAIGMVREANFIVSKYSENSVALHDAIRLCNESLRTLTEEDYPAEYSSIMNIMGMAYRRLSSVENVKIYLNLSISHYSRSLKIKQTDEYDTASTNTNIGIAYRMLSLLEENQVYLKKAKMALSRSLDVRKPEKYPYECASTLYEMGIVLVSEYDSTKDPEKLTSGISCLSEAKETFYEFMTKEHEETFFYPLYDYSSSCFFIGKAYAKLAQVRDAEENLIFATEFFSNVLEYMPMDEYPENYGDAAFQMGNALFDLYKANGSKAELLKAIDHYEISKSVFTVEKEPHMFAAIIDEMGKAYLCLAKESHMDSHINTAMWLFDQSYTILSDLDSPEKEEVLKNYNEAKAYYNDYSKGGGIIYV